MNTNNKNHPVYQYIIDAIDAENLTTDHNLSKQPETDAEKLQTVLNIFRSEYDFEIKRRGEYSAFREWLMGLPSAINIDFENYRILEIAKLWGSIPENATEKQEDKILENWFNFITVKFFQICKRNKVF